MATRSPIRGKKGAPGEKKSDVAESSKSSQASGEAVIDFPQEGEYVTTGHYAVRISASTGFDVEFNDGGSDWWPCRESVGYFWFDWWPTHAGKTILSVRFKSGNGRWKTSPGRTCNVTVNGSN